MLSPQAHGPYQCGPPQPSTARPTDITTPDRDKHRGPRCLSKRICTFLGVTQVSWQDGTSTGYATWNR